MVKGNLTKEITDLTKGAGTKEGQENCFAETENLNCESSEKVEDVKKQIKNLLPGLLN